MAYNPLYVAPGSNRPPVEPESSPFWIDPACTDVPSYAVVSPERKCVAGLLAQQSGKLWRYVTSHLKVLRSTTNRRYFEEITYIKVPAFLSCIMEPVQFHYALASVSDKDISADGWSHCVDNVSMPPNLLKPFDMSLLEPQDRIPHGNCVAFVNFAH